MTYLYFTVQHRNKKAWDMGWTDSFTTWSEYHAKAKARRMAKTMGKKNVRVFKVVHTPVAL